MAATPHSDEDKDTPLDPAVERVRRRLVRFIAINLSLLFVALMAVVAAIVYRAGSSEEPSAPAVVSELPMPAAGAPLEGEIALPKNTRILGHALSGGRLSIDAQLADGSRVVFLYDLAEARMVGRFAVTGAAAQ